MFIRSTALIGWCLSCSLSWLAVVSIHNGDMDVARSAPQGAHTCTDETGWKLTANKEGGSLWHSNTNSVLDGQSFRGGGDKDSQSWHTGLEVSQTTGGSRSPDQRQQDKASSESSQDA